MPSQKVELPLNGPTFQSRFSAANFQECVNWYLESSPNQKTNVALFPTPGSRWLHTIGGVDTNPIRGLATDPSDPAEPMYAVVGEDLYTFQPQGTNTVTAGYVEEGYWDLGYTDEDAGAELSENALTISLIGNMAGFPTTTPVSIEINKTYVFIVSLGEGEAWVYNKDTATLTKVTDTDYPFNQSPSLKVNSTTYHDGYFFVTIKNSEQFYVSDLNNPLSWTATNFASAETAPDVLVKAISTKKDVWLLGKNSVEIWTNTGNPDFPFEPIPNAYFDIGCLAPLSTAIIDDELIFLSRDKSGWGQVVKFNGFNLEYISNASIEQILNKDIQNFFLDTSVTNFKENIVAYAYKDRGHSFYVLTIPEFLETSDGGNTPQGMTFVYDLITKQWHEWKTVLFSPGQSNIEGRHFSGETFAVSRYRFFAGFYRDNRLLEISSREFSDFVVRDSNGVITARRDINRVRTAPYITDRRNRTFWHSVEVDASQGSFDEVDGDPPSLSLSWSDDQAKTFSNPIPKNTSTTEISRLRWNRLGESRDRVYRISTNASSEVSILGTYAEFTAGEH